MPTAIPYGDENWPVVTGCSGAGCTAQCWARAMAHRFHRSFAPTFHPEKLTQPMHWRRPRVVTVALTGDLFDGAITNEEIATVYNVMATTRHTFLVLTKQAARMRDWYRWVETFRDHVSRDGPHALNVVPWPLPNVYLGVSAITQAEVEERVERLCECPAVVRWLSAEPLIEPLNLGRYIRPAVADGRPMWPCHEPILFGLDWVVTAAESGPRARPCSPWWVRTIRDDCALSQVDFAFKDQTGYPLLDGVRHDAFPLTTRPSRA